MNPITALFAPIEKLISEHGSAAILRNHVAFRDQLAVLKEKFAVLATENERLKSENQTLKTENINLTKKIDEYENDNPFGHGMVQESQFKHLP